MIDRQQPPMPKTRIHEIDLLRFLAALSVVFYHYTFRGFAADNMSVMPYPLLAPFSKYGYLGAELYFMISGFVILMTAARGSLRDFFVSRVTRLYPAFWACCTLTFLTILTLGGTHYSVSIRQYLVNMTMLSDFFKVPAIDGVYWTLFLEIKFYTLVAFILVIGKIDKVERLIIFWLIFSVALEVLPISLFRYFLIVNYSAYFIAGATYFLIWSKGITLTRVGIIVSSWMLALFQDITRLPNLDEHYHTKMSSYAVTGIISAFFIVMLLVSIRCTGVFGRNRWQLAGVLSYPLYLLHQRIGFMIFNIAYPTINPHLLIYCTLLFVLAAAYAVHRLIEKRLSSRMKNALSHFLDTLQRLTRHAAGASPETPRG